MAFYTSSTCTVLVSFGASGELVLRLQYCFIASLRNAGHYHRTYRPPHTIHDPLG